MQRVAVAMLPTNFAAARDGNLAGTVAAVRGTSLDPLAGACFTSEPMTGRSGWPSTDTQRTGPDLRHDLWTWATLGGSAPTRDGYARRVGMPTGSLAKPRRDDGRRAASRGSQH